MKNRIFLVATVVIIVAAYVSYVKFGFFTFRRNAANTVSLNAGWQFEHDGTSYPAIVPGCIYNDLIINKLIKDPFFGTNEDSVAWVGKKSWTYKTSFSKKDIKKFDNTTLVFDGLDTYADIYLNGQLMGHADNTYRRWEFPLHDDMLKEDNVLSVVFSPDDSINILKSKNHYCLLPDLRAFTRKAPYQRGWDWGPNLPSCGIWQNVCLKQWNEVMISDVQIYRRNITDSVANIDINVRLLSDEDENTGSLQLNIDGKKSNVIDNVKLERGINRITFHAEIENPELWWPNGMGEQKMYDVEVVFTTHNHKDKLSKKVGLRTVELVQNADSIGQSFFFVVNGKPMYAKGANYIPPESFMTNITNAKYDRLITACRDAGMNMLRVWGGGQYENDYFYTCCDKNGILVWQDFMFSCALYPANKEMIENISQEAEYQILRLRNHPCIALWCGNNEVKNGWDDWGWQNNYTDTEKDSLQRDYDRIFKGILPNAVKLSDYETDYIETSPLWGWGHPESNLSGDAHYWGVWWGEQPFEVWYDKTGRFMSEYGFQSYPHYATIEKFTDENMRFLDSPQVQHHQKHARGKIIVDNAMEHYFGVPKNFDDYVYVSQLLQAYGVGMAIDAHRIKTPYCMGTLYWQLNDCWPSISWSSIDYYGHRKALYYTTKKKFQHVIMSALNHNDTISIYAISDLNENINVYAAINVISFAGDTLYTKKTNVVTLPALSSQIVDDIVIDKTLNQHKSSSYVTLSLQSQDDVHSFNDVIFMVLPKDVKLPQSSVEMKVDEGREYSITLKSSTLAKSVFVYTSDDVDGTFSDNYFDMLPGEVKTIKFYPSGKTKNIDFRIKTYNDVV